MHEDFVAKAAARARTTGKSVIMNTSSTSSPLPTDAHRLCGASWRQM
jgi:hypothetical protein